MDSWSAPTSTPPIASSASRIGHAVATRRATWWRSSRRCRSNSLPGRAWNYSVSTGVVGHLVEVISGQRLEAYLREHVLQPLGMTDTAFIVTEEQTRRFAANYQRLPDDRLKLIDDPARSIYRDCAFFSGGGG